MNLPKLVRQYCGQSLNSCVRLCSILATLDSFWDEHGGGGWGGGEGQQAHLAVTYASTAALLEAGLLGRWLAGSRGAARRQQLYRTLLSLKHESGGFRVHRGGEVDIRYADIVHIQVCQCAYLESIFSQEKSKKQWITVMLWFLQMLCIRGAYCAIATASMMHMVTEELAEGVLQYVVSCQNYDGGIAGEPGAESHGGYTYCGKK